MDNTTAPRPSADHAAPNDPPRAVVVAPATAPAPHDGPDQPALPFDDAADDPIPYALTARARRTVAPDRLPALRVVGHDRPPRSGAAGELDDHGDLDDPRDTRSARARALRRAGSGVAAIAAQLDVDELVVRAWVGDVTVRRAVHGQAGPHDSVPPRDRGGARRSPVTDDTAEDDRLAFELARASARSEVRHQLDVDAGFASGLGVVAALADIDPHAVTVVTPRLDLAAAAARWLDAQLPVDGSRRRLVLRIGPEVPGDLARHRWAQATGLEPEAVSFTRWRSAPTPDAIEALLRVADASVAATLAGWCDALLDPSLDDPADLAF